MSIDRIIFVMAGSFILISLALSHYHDPNWIYLTAFMGVNLLQAGFTRWCLMASIFKMIGFKPGNAFK